MNKKHFIKKWAGQWNSSADTHETVSPETWEKAVEKTGCTVEGCKKFIENITNLTTPRETFEIKDSPFDGTKTALAGVHKKQDGEVLEEWEAEILTLIKNGASIRFTVEEKEDPPKKEPPTVIEPIPPSPIMEEMSSTSYTWGATT